jgi:hypothetical protein
MGASKKEHEKMTYFITTDPMTGLEYINNFTQPCSKFIKDWSREPDDYYLYKDDPKFKELNKKVKEAKKERDAYKEQIRKQNK